MARREAGHGAYAHRLPCPSQAHRSRSCLRSPGGLAARSGTRRQGTWQRSTAPACSASSSSHSIRRGVCCHRRLRCARSSGNQLISWLNSLLRQTCAVPTPTSTCPSRRRLEPRWGGLRRATPGAPGPTGAGAGGRRAGCPPRARLRRSSDPSIPAGGRRRRGNAKLLHAVASCGAFSEANPPLTCHQFTSEAL